MLHILKKTMIVLCSLLLAACQSHSDSVLSVGTIAGPETDLMEVAKQVALERYGLKIRIVTFSDYMQPNSALADGSIDANLFQHQAWLDQQNRDHHYHLVAIGRGFVYPMGIYPGKTRTLQALPQNALIALPNDPSNEGRALLLLQKAGVIQLKANAGLYATPADIVSNPHDVHFKELDAAQLARSLRDVDFAAINTNFAVLAGLSPVNDAVFREGSDSPYANIIVVQENRRDDPRLKQLVAACQSDAVLKEAKKIFDGQAIPAW